MATLDHSGASGEHRVYRVVSNGIGLNVLELAPHHRSRATVIMQHGLRDSAFALLPIARQLSEHFHVLLPELRGHGRSDHSDAYGVYDFVLNLKEVAIALAGQRIALFGHSLGGHIVSKYAAIFPEQVDAVAIVEGLGPPHRAHESNEPAEMQVLQFMIMNRLRHQERRSRPIKTQADALERLLRNNPRLNAEQAQELIPHLLTQTDEGLAWAFDSRANSVFVGASRANDAKFWRNIQAPTCVVSGSLSFEYWGAEMGDANFDGRFAENEMQQRIDLFQDCEHHWFEQSGHMVHYDEPARLAELCTHFYREKLDL
ncbi:MAG: alpha/beta fold hydrolase [Proteobacteria bacterium]|nr:alpha/beta fold hydrolase [Pseudomonadota bacterium]